MWIQRIEVTAEACWQSIFDAFNFFAIDSAYGLPLSS
jgi:hypothetical protein